MCKSKTLVPTTVDICHPPQHLYSPMPTAPTFCIAPSEVHALPLPHLRPPLLHSFRPLVHNHAVRCNKAVYRLPFHLIHQSGMLDSRTQTYTIRSFITLPTYAKQTDGGKREGRGGGTVEATTMGTMGTWVTHIFLCVKHGFLHIGNVDNLLGVAISDKCEILWFDSLSLYLSCYLFLYCPRLSNCRKLFELQQQIVF